MSAAASYGESRPRDLLAAAPSFSLLNTWKEGRHQLEKISITVANGLQTSPESPLYLAGESCSTTPTSTWNLRSTTKKISTAGAVESEESKTVRWCSRERRRIAPASAERRRFSVSLSPEEIAEDIYAFTGSLPRRRPRKRPRGVQKQLDVMFPCLWLTEVTPDLYKVPDS